jgi:hypothetical protein
MCSFHRSHDSRRLRRQKGRTGPHNNEMQLTRRTEAGRVSQIGCLHLKSASQLISVFDGRKVSDGAP